MAFLPHEGAEPIPGYRLIKKLGSGGYGEVWQAIAPGDLTKAIKIIFGSTHDARAETELRALNRIKEVRHPFLLSLERVEIRENQLFIVTELADGSVMERFDSCRRHRLPGIPREELVGYLRDAADALDYMNEKYGLLHLDVKPQNLLLVAGRIKIADFGLVKEMGSKSVTAASGVTPIYASPEAFENRVSRFSDQYSLAVVYQEMLTGTRPFPGRTTLQLAYQHLTGTPQLDALPEPDRAVVARALAKLPEERYSSCRDMVEHLLAARRLVGAMPKRPQTADTSRSVDHDASDITVRIRRRPQPTLPNLDGDTQWALDHAGDSTPVLADAFDLRPTLFIGLGGLANATLSDLHHNLGQRFGNLSRIPTFQFLLLDTDRDGLRTSTDGKHVDALSGNEILFLPLRRPDDYRAESKDLLRWLDRRWLYGIPRSLKTEGMRPLGRLAFVTHAQEIAERLRTAITLVTSSSAVATTESATGLPIRDRTLRIVIVAACSGGTGSGMLMDTSSTVNQILQEQNVSGADVEVFLLFATSDIPAQAELGRVNAYATLEELLHQSRAWTAHPDDRRDDPSVIDRAGLFTDCHFVHLGETLSESDAQSSAKDVADYLYFATATPMGSKVHPRQRSTGLSLRTFGWSRITFPLAETAEFAAKLIGREVVGRWLLERTFDRLSGARQTLTQLAQSFDTSRGSHVNAGTRRRPGVTELFPGGCTSPFEAAKWLFQRMGHGLVDAVDASLRDAMFGNAKLSATPIRSAVLNAARDAALGALKGTDAAQLLIETHCDEKALIDVIQTHVQRSAPRLAQTGGPLRLILGVPTSTAGEHIETLTHPCTSATSLAIVETECDVIFCTEESGLPVSGVAAALIDNDPARREIARQVHTRVDVAWTELS